MKVFNVFETIFTCFLSYCAVACLEYLTFLNIPLVVTWISYILLYIFTFYWVGRALRKFVFRFKVSPLNKAVLITGCDSGFGNLLAKKLHFEGYKVFAGCYIPTGEGAQKLEQTSCGKIHIVGLDVTKSDSVSQCFDYVVQHLEKSELWAVVNNAGVLSVLEVEFEDEDNYRRLYEVNALGLVRVTKAFLPLLRKSKGRVVTVTSMAGRVSLPNFSSYAMSKYAATAFCDCLRQEMRPWGVKVVTIEPQIYRTEMTSAEILMDAVEKAWMNAPEQTRLDYGETGLQKMKHFLRFFQFHGSERLYQVTDSMFEAVGIQYVQIILNPRQKSSSEEQEWHRGRIDQLAYKYDYEQSKITVCVSL